MIPLNNALSSVGLVISPERKGLKWDDALKECPEAARVLANAEAQGRPMGHQDFTEYATTFSGPGWGLVGDAALFLDPIYSSGMLFALESAEWFSRVINGTLSAGDYERQIRAAAALFEPLIIGFYDEDFHELGFAEKSVQSPQFRSGTVSLLAGNVFDDAPRYAKIVSRRLSDLAAQLRADRQKS